ncbi:auxin-responsive protein SAUR71-like [Phalaenopsis equestris]|uniref:auxin-responsive protein SAUR71-like n=1 Tax=Phalaenopsis equestris TaxID=78828 RepID=UPI0009E3973E|nr:auxin-responsive protein SAUR71-like [Phalaenopsis equestris]
MGLYQSSTRPRSLISKTLQRCLSLKSQSGRYAVSPAGWVSVQVGREKEKFLIRAEWMNHSLFRGLLDEAEKEYGYAGYAAKGSLELPCSIEVFHLVLWEMDQEEADCAAAATAVMCGFGALPLRGARRGYRLLGQSRAVAACRLYG